MQTFVVTCEAGKSIVRMCLGRFKCIPLTTLTAREHARGSTSAHGCADVQLPIRPQRGVRFWVAHFPLHVPQRVSDDLDAAQRAIALEGDLRPAQHCAACWMPPTGHRALVTEKQARGTPV